MTGLVNDGQLVTVESAIAKPFGDIRKGDIVLCEVNGRQYLHRVLDVVVDIDRGGQKIYQIGNNRGGINGWIRRDAIYGKLTKVED